MALALKTWTRVCGGSGFGSAFQNGATLTSVYQAMPGTNQSALGALVIPWVGGIIDQDNKRLIFCANGGHGDYWGNEVYACELNAAVPFWRRLADYSPITAYSSNPPNNVGTNNAKDNFGRCAAMHTSNTQCYGDGKIWTMSQSSYSNLGVSSNAIYSYNLRDAALLAANSGGNSLTFDNATSGPWHFVGNATGNTGSFGMGCYDKAGHRAYGVSTDQSNSTSAFCSVDTISGVLKNHSAINGGNYQSGCCVVAYDLRLLVLIDQTGAINICDISNPATPGAPIAITVTGPWSGIGNSFGWGCVYHRPSSSLLFYNSNNSACTGGVIIKVKIPRNANGSKASGSWASSAISPAGGTISPEGSLSGGTYGKFGLIDNMNNGQGLLVCCLGVAAGFTYVYKLPAGELL